MQSRFGMRDVVRFLYTHNPFYLISACLILYGLRVSFHVEAGELVNSWALLMSVCCYCLLLAVTSYLMIRFGKVWDDARSILLILLLLIVAMSISFDEIVNMDPSDGLGILIFGFCFSAGLSEFLIRGLGIQFRTLFRMPYYGILALFFLYPLWCSYEITGLPRDGTIQWRVFLFPTFAAGVFLLLLPAIRRGRRYTARNGTPWHWPWFPWAVFGVLTFAVCVRSYVLSIAYLPADGMTSSFGWYSLIPFALVIFVLLMEIGIVERRPGFSRTVMAVAPLLLLLAMPIGPENRSYAYETFLLKFIDVVGSPIYLTSIGLLAFYAYAWIRRQREAAAGVIMSLFLLAIFDRNAMDLSPVGTIQAWPFLALAMIQLWLSFSRRSSGFATGALACGIVFLIVSFRNTDFMEYYAMYPIHMALAGLLLIGFVFRDPLAQVLRGLAASGLPIVSIVTVLLPDVSPLSDSMSVVYFAAITLIAFVFWRKLKDWLFLGAVSVNVLFTLGFGSRHLYAELSATAIGRGAAPLFWGLASFLVAAIISLAKTGMLKESCRNLLRSRDTANGNS